MPNPPSTNLRLRPFLWLGIGAILATVVELWRRYAEATGSGEGAAITTYALATVLGFPTSIVMIRLIELLYPALSRLPGPVEYLLTLLAVVINWTLIGALFRRWRKRVAKDADSVDRSVGGAGSNE